MEINGSLHLFVPLNCFKDYKQCMFFADPKKVKEVSDLWFIGDDFVNETYHALPDMMKEAKMSNKDGPYIYKMYNVHCFTSKPGSLTRSVPVCMVNCLIKVLNESFNLPCFVIMVPDWDILQ